MSSYEEAGVNIELGDKCSALAYQAAKNTFPSRKGMIGEPVVDDGGFAGALDMGDYYLIQGDDGVGTKMIIGEKSGQLGTLGSDLVAMVCDDAVCVGAETISMTNTLDVDEVNESKVAALMQGLEEAAKEQKIVIPGGEIAELGSMVNGYVWNATAVGIVEKSKLITGEKVAIGDKLIALESRGLRSNGFSLVRHILTNKYGENWYSEMFDEHQTWAEAVLVPSRIYSNCILDMHGRYGEESKVELKAVVHVTGGGIPGNLPRTLKKTGLGAKIGNLPEPHSVMKRLVELGGVERSEAYRTWNMGIGMIIIASPDQAAEVQKIAFEHGINSQIIGEVVEKPGVEF